MDASNGFDRRRFLIGSGLCIARHLRMEGPPGRLPVSATGWRRYHGQHAADQMPAPGREPILIASYLSGSGASHDASNGAHARIAEAIVRRMG